MTAYTAPNTFLDRLDAAGVTYEKIPHSRTNTAADEARVLGVEPRLVAKTLVLVTPSGFVLAIVPASKRLDLHKVRDLLAVREVELATEEILAEAYPDFEVGAVPPIGIHGERALVDRGVTENESVLVEAGTHDESLRIRTLDLLALNYAVVADISRE